MTMPFAKDDMEFMANPDKWGAPTFEQFKRNPEKWLGRHDDKFANIDNGPIQIRNYMDKVRFEINGWRCKSLEEVERVAGEYGVDIGSLDYTAEFLPLGGGKGDILVKFISREERQRRAAW